MTTARALYEGFLSLFYPHLCLACDRNIAPGLESLCLSCRYHLPKTNYHLEKENPFTDRIWGRFPFQTGTALYHFSKGGRVQQLIHHLKYKQQRQIGIKLGEILGRQLRESPHYRGVDAIIPVPLHPRKVKLRGYNQSALIAEGLSNSMEVPWQNYSLIRTTYGESQTNKTRLERLQNVGSAFTVKQPERIRNLNLLLVDDVLTTGATLEACAQQLLKASCKNISLATIAMAGQ